MNQQKLLKELHDGSTAQRKRFRKLKTNAEKQRYAEKILEGNRNTIRTFSLRLFVLWFQNRALYHELKHIKEVMEQFEECIIKYNAVIGDKEKEKQSLKTILDVIKEYETTKKYLLKIKTTSLRDQSYIIYALLVLTLTMLLFKNGAHVQFDNKIFSENNRYNPLNPYFPLELVTRHKT